MAAGRFVALVLGLDLVLLGSALALALLAGGAGSVVGVLAGGGLGTANLVGLAWLCGRMVAPGGRRWIYAILLALKFAAMVGLVFLAVRHLDMDVIWFVAGLTTAGLAVVGSTSYLAIRGVELRL